MTGVNFNKICMFCDKCRVCIDKCVFIVIKIKCVNLGRISNICDKVNFITRILLTSALRAMVKDY